MDKGKTLAFLFIITQCILATVNVKAATTGTTATEPAGGSTMDGSTTDGAAGETTTPGAAGETMTPGPPMGGTTGGTTDGTRPTEGAGGSEGPTGTPAGTIPTEGITEEPTEKQPTEKVPTEEPPRTEFDGEFRITRVNDEVVDLSTDLENPESPYFKNMSDQVCKAVEAALDGSSFEDDFTGCTVSEYKSGSIIAVFRVAFTNNAAVTAEELTAQIKLAFNMSNDPLITMFRVDPDSFKFNDVAQATDAPITTKPVDSGLSVGAIVGIAVGGAVLLVIVIVIIVVVVMKVNGNSQKVTSVEEAELQPESGKNDRSPSVGS